MNLIRKGEQWSKRCLWSHLLVLLLLVCLSSTPAVVLAQSDNDNRGPDSLARGQALFQEHKFQEAAPELWTAVLMHGNTPPAQQYDVQLAFTQFMQCYIQQGRMADGLAFVSSESFKRGQTEMGQSYLEQALAADPTNEAARLVQLEFGSATSTTGAAAPTATTQDDDTNDDDASHTNNADLVGKTPEELYGVASEHFSGKRYEECADVFEISCVRSGHKLGPSCANAVYCRALIVDYGFNGTQFDRDMERITALITKETQLYRKTINDEGNEASSFAWNRAMSVHPHMTLGYPIDVVLKRYVAESVAFLDEKMARAANSQATGTGRLMDLPVDMPFDMNAARQKFLEQAASEPQHKLKVGFVGSGFNSKAVLYLSQDMFRFFDPAIFELHVFSFGPADNPLFIKHGMRGVDWRARVEQNVDFFHDCQAMKMDHVKAARFIHDHDISILIEWDGYARQGERAQGLFALRPAPIQILHQEYLGSSGALYVDYLFTDAITTVPGKEHLYTEKLLRLPNHFFSKGHAYQAEVKKPTMEYAPKASVYKFGTGSPQQNRCLSRANLGPSEVSFVYCNFNKLLKANPETLRSWVRILREVPDSILCLLENPDIAVPYVRKFIHEAAGTSSNHNDPTSFVGGDGEDLNDRIHFLQWEKNPFDHQARNQDFCNVMLDSHPYNGHTVAQDALYGGVPIVTRSDGDDMSSRVTTSANTVLGLEELNAYNGPQQYEDIAIKIGKDEPFYRSTRKKLIDSCLQRNPMHPYWDVARYVKNFEAGLLQAWELFLDGKPPQHIQIEESPRAAKGTFDDEILANPPDGKKSRARSDEL